MTAKKTKASKKTAASKPDFAGQVELTKKQMEEDERKIMEELEREQAEIDARLAKEEEERKKAVSKARVIVAVNGGKKPAPKKPAQKKKTAKKPAPKKAPEQVKEERVAKVNTPPPPTKAQARKGLKKKAPAAKPKPKPKAIPAHTYREDEVVMYNPRHLEVEDGWNPRFDMGDMQTMIHSVGTRGVRQPIICKLRMLSATGEPLKTPRLVVSSGHRRQMAAVKALDKGYTACNKVPVIVRQYKNEEEAFADSLILNDHKALNPVEVCAALNRYVAQGHTIKEIAELAGKRQTWVRARLALKDAGARLTTLLVKGDISVQDSVEIIKQADGDPESQDRLVSKRNIVKKKQKMSKRPVDDDGVKITPAASRRLLSDIASAYMRFRRGKGPAKTYNEDWVELEELLRKVHRAKAQGKLGV